PGNAIVPGLKYLIKAICSIGIVAIDSVPSCSISFKKIFTGMPFPVNENERGEVKSYWTSAEFEIL
ncbi:MAG TPA: hypothetical protein VET23_11595, partial [Chitinophagaceae bacterium]|nr:hypothetical protein [Chitinophagaceae bacterium]